MNQFDVAIRFCGGPPTVAELVALRSCLAQYRNMPPAELRNLVGNSRELKLGTYSPVDFFALQRNADRVGLEVAATDASYTTFQPIDRTTDQIWLIDNDDDARQVACEMISAGIPVIEISSS